MVDSCSMKHPPADLKGLFFLLRRRRTKAFAYGFMLSFLLCTAYIAFNPAFGGTPWLSNFLSTASASTDSYRSRLTSFLASASESTASYKSQLSSFISSFFPNSTPPDRRGWSPPNPAFGANRTGFAIASPKAAILAKNLTSSGIGSPKDTIFLKNSTSTGVGSPKVPVLVKNLTTGGVGSPRIRNPAGKAQQNTSFAGIAGSSRGSNQTKSGAAAPEIGSLVKNHSSSTAGSPKVQISSKNLTTTTEGGSESDLKAPPPPSLRNQSVTGVVVPKKSESPIGGQIKTGPTLLKSDALVKNNSLSGMMSPSAGTVPPAPAAKTQTNKSSVPAMPLKQLPPSPQAANGGGTSPKWNIESMRKCNLFHGKWVKDESYPMYPPGSCPHIDESFDCFLNGRPEFSYQKLRWQPHGCYIPRFNATDMLERLRGKRLVFVGDSLNRNMWESLVCILTNSVKDKSKVFESSGRHEFKTDGSYSFVFKDYNCTVEFFRSVFLVQEWEMRDTSGNEKETLRLDMIAKSSDRYKDADIIVFNTGHWWTHDKTAKGKDYYQEGNRIYSQLNVVDAFHKALNTWAKWVDANVNSRKTTVFFRGYSSSHFSGGQWNSGGQCDAETEPIKNEHYLAPYPPKMDVLESVLQRMKTPVAYLNITRMTNYRKDAHPSIYRKPDLTEDERRAPNRYQDCSHWCLPGVPDSWNELLYAQLLIKQYELH